MTNEAAVKALAHYHSLAAELAALREESRALATRTKQRHALRHRRNRDRAVRCVVLLQGELTMKVMHSMNVLRFKIGDRLTLGSERREIGEVNVIIDNIAFKQDIKMTVKGLTPCQVEDIKARVKRIIFAHEAYLWSYWWDEDTGIELERVS